MKTKNPPEFSKFIDGFMHVQKSSVLPTSLVEKNRFSVAIVLPADGKSMMQIMRCATAVARQYHISQVAATGPLSLIHI